MLELFEGTEGAEREREGERLEQLEPKAEAARQIKTNGSWLATQQKSAF